MHRAFNLTFKTGYFNSPEFQTAGREIFKKYRNKIARGLEDFKNTKNELNGEMIMDRWFPDLFPDIFLSHSHKDHEDVVGLAGWLKITFGLDSFVDSSAWGYAEDLLKEIDDNYCTATNTTYSYAKRNGSTTHVHLMLANSLHRLINASECVIFVNTPNSISINEIITSSPTTLSPWIYTELQMTKLIQTRLAQAHRKDKKLWESSNIGISVEAAFDVRYTANLGHLTPLDLNDILTWKRKFPGPPHSPTDALDALYKQKPKAIETLHI